MEKILLVACGMLLGWAGADLMQDMWPPFIFQRGFAHVTWHAHVVTPGLPAGTRRLGDLRLECRVATGTGFVAHLPALLRGLHSSATAPCDGPGRSPHLFYADKPIFNVLLQDGVRRKSIAAADLYAGYRTAKEAWMAKCDCQDMLARSYSLPLWDRTWSDETLVRVEYMDEPANGGEIHARLDPSDIQISLVTGETTGADMLAYATPGRRVKLLHGFESWLFAVKPRTGSDGAAPADLVVLIDPDGLVRKARVRQSSAGL